MKLYPYQTQQLNPTAAVQANKTEPKSPPPATQPNSNYWKVETYATEPKSHLLLPHSPLQKLFKKWNVTQIHHPPNSRVFFGYV